MTTFIVRCESIFAMPGTASSPAVTMASNVCADAHHVVGQSEHPTQFDDLVEGGDLNFEVLDGVAIPVGELDVLPAVAIALGAPPLNRVAPG